MSIQTVLPSAFDRSASRVTCIAVCSGSRSNPSWVSLTETSLSTPISLDPIQEAQVLGRRRGGLTKVGDVLAEHRERGGETVAAEPLRGGERVVGRLARHELLDGLPHEPKTGETLTEGGVPRGPEDRVAQRVHTLRAYRTTRMASRPGVACYRPRMSEPADTAAAPSDRTRVRRIPELGAYDRPTIDAILDAGIVAHLGFVHEGQPFVIPTLHPRIDDVLYVHGSAASRTLKAVAEGVRVCVTVTLLDGIVLARSIFEHSIDYRSVVVLGVPRLIDDPEEKLAALHAFSEQVLAGTLGRLPPAQRPGTEGDEHPRATTHRGEREDQCRPAGGRRLARRRARRMGGQHPPGGDGEGARSRTRRSALASRCRRTRPNTTAPASPTERLNAAQASIAATSSRQKSGMSSTTRPHTTGPSRKAGSSTHVAPAFPRSSLMPRLPVARRPATIPAEMPTSPA